MPDLPARDRAPLSGLDLDDHDVSEADRRASPPATILYEAVLREARDELSRSSGALFWSGLAAGLSIGFSFVGRSLLGAALPEASWTPLVTSLGYALGFLVVIIGRQQLFTENTLTPVVSVLRQKTWAAFGGMLRLWGIVLGANLVGAAVFAYLLWIDSGVFTDAQMAEFARVGRHVVETGPGTTFGGGIYAGWLLALLVWMLPSAERSRVVLIVVVAYAIGLGGFAHSITGTSEAVYAVLAGEAGWGAIPAFLVPALAGNIVGGVGLVAVLNYAQAAADGED
ncbi:formate/nitrite transporter family protein [Rubrivirga sp. S365]|uniref:Formate/nitrite transporter family protein n=1 Tax=Rubrivirga litoralis TaxID=3075598 RepID=A0ABU3BQV6_9BACT|nr:MULTISPECIES: formate/nitrite transporter family protein [unclassified Rubrivirga]MDT0631666.1 formate/nitrite transporter family protein [Rubrivirga sp. F394]MDT7855591.1 formate/nitrite transporter family protein [Rubrivirga sp. S365]